MSAVTKQWNLGDPKECREFLKEVRVGPEQKPITHFFKADGKAIPIDEASNEQVTQVAFDIASMLKTGVKNK